jgi:hypothetical protein
MFELQAMEWPSVINRLYFFVTSLNLCVSLVFLSVAIVNRRRCSNFSTLLACNTALYVFCFSVTNLSMAIYMFIWDQAEIVTIDHLCSLRAYFYHSTIALIHHSFLVQEIDRYCRIRRAKFLQRISHQVMIVLFQWLFDFTFALPVFLTNNLTKLTSDNICFVPLSRIELVFYMAILTFFMTDLTLIFIYRLLVYSVQRASAQVTLQRHKQMRRDLVVTRRIVILHSQLALIGLPVLAFIIITLINAAILPRRLMRVLLLLANLPLSVLLVILFWLIPDLRLSLINFRNRVHPVLTSSQQHRPGNPSANQN